MTYISTEILKTEQYTTVGEGFESNVNKKGGILVESHSDGTLREFTAFANYVFTLGHL